MQSEQKSVQRSVVRLVLDTNVVASGLMWDGATARLFELTTDGPWNVELICSQAMLTELRDIIGRRKFSRRLSLKATSADAFVNDYAQRTTLVAPASIPPTVHEDPDDDIVVATALAGQAHLLVTGDAHLLALGNVRYVPIVRPAAAITMLGGPKRRSPGRSPPKGGRHPRRL
ncbi:putative toxin-antitoxin system toxin component, PIN family [Roseateles sp.]|uniref:putative toxin-antitoxin system toxin component, PIN family n=1 Tax=Roseateles sp. TaxID=1971397 RepID=UPI0031D6B3BB